LRLKEAKKAGFLKSLVDRRSALGSGAAGGGGGSRAEAPQGEQKPGVFSELGAAWQRRGIWQPRAHKAHALKGGIQEGGEEEH
jgi:hypothetical protein